MIIKSQNNRIKDSNPQSLQKIVLKAYSKKVLYFLMNRNLWTSHYKYITKSTIRFNKGLNKRMDDRWSEPIKNRLEDINLEYT